MPDKPWKYEDENKNAWYKIRSLRISQDDHNKVFMKYTFDGQPVVLDIFQKKKDVDGLPMHQPMQTFEVHQLDPLQIDTDTNRGLLKICEIKIILDLNHD